MKRFLALLIGVIFIAAGAFLYFKNSNLQKVCTTEAVAIVKDFHEEISTDNDSTSFIYYPIIEYTVEEEKVRVTMDNGSSSPKYNIGDKIDILYNPQKINEFIVKGDKSSNIMSIVIIALGMFVSGYGIVIALKKED